MLFINMINNNKIITHCSWQLKFITTLQEEEFRRKMVTDHQDLQSANEEIAALKAELENSRKEIAERVNEKEEQLEHLKTKDRQRKLTIRTYETRIQELESKLEERERSRWVQVKILSLHYMVYQKNKFRLRI